MRRTLAFDNWHAAPWAVRSEALNVVARVLSGEMGDDEIRAEIARRADTATQPQIGGGVAVIPLRGLITPRMSLLSLLFGGGGGLQSFRSDLRTALGADEVGSILIDIDSPGGSTSLLTETAAEIRAARDVKPVVAVANTMAASAAYWLGSQADELVVTPSGEVGSIGVFAVHENWAGFNEQAGIEPTYIVAGKYKAEANPDSPLSDEAKAAIQQTIDEFYGLFVDDVAAGRGVTAQAVRDGFGEGRMVTAQRSVALGMADRVASYEDVLSELASPQGAPRRSAQLERPAPAAKNPQQHDNPPPNELRSEEETARIGELVTARPSHILQEGSPA